MARIREFPIEREALAEAAKQMKRYMLELVARRDRREADDERSIES
jgi:hypothetical protein